MTETPTSEVRRRLIFQGVLLLLGGVMLGTVGLVELNKELLRYDHPGYRFSRLLLLVMGSGLVLLGLALAVGRVRRGLGRLGRYAPIALNLSLSLVGLLAGLLMVEFVLGLEQRSLVQPVADPQLGLRLPSNAAGHDSWGFRNEAVPEQVDIVAIGDSQTYGVGASRDRAWPQTLARLSGRSVYNMGLGYYGPAQYWVLTGEALELSPEIIVVGLYFGNDIWGAYSLVYNNGYYAAFRDEAHPEWEQDTVSEQVHALLSQKVLFEDEYWARLPLSRAWDDWLISTATGGFLYRQGLLSGLNRTSRYEQSRAWAQAYPEQAVVYDEEPVRTVMTPAYRLLALDLEEPRIVEGLRLTQEMLLLIQERTEAADVRLVVLLIPTKETVYAEAVAGQPDPMAESYTRLVQMEEQARTGIIQFCETHHIAYVDGLPPLREAISGREQVYPAYDDGHPVGAGYALLAEAVHEKLLELGW